MPFPISSHGVLRASGCSAELSEVRQAIESRLAKRRARLGSDDRIRFRGNVLFASFFPFSLLAISSAVISLKHDGADLVAAYEADFKGLAALALIVVAGGPLFGLRR